MCLGVHIGPSDSIFWGPKSEIQREVDDQISPTELEMNSDDDEGQDAEEDQVESQVDPQELGIPGEGSEEEGDEEREEGDPVVDSDREDPNKNPDQATTLEVEYEEYDSYWRVEKAEMELAAAREEMELAAAREEMELAAAR